MAKNKNKRRTKFLDFQNIYCNVNKKNVNKKKCQQKKCQQKKMSTKKNINKKKLIHFFLTNIKITLRC